MGITIRLYLDFVRIGLMEGLAFRLRNLLALISYPVIILANYHLYRAVYANRPGGTIENHSVEEAIGYMLLVWTLRSIFQTRIDASVGERVRSGDVAIDLIRPISYPLAQMSHSLGASLHRGFTVTLPLLVLAVFFIPVSVPQTVSGWLLLFASVGFGFCIMVLTKFLVGMLAFYMEFNENLRFTFEMIQRVLGGLMIPLSFLPETVFHILQYLPFQYIYFVPAEVCLGKVADPVTVLLIPAAWVLGLAGVARWTMGSGVRRLSIQGG